MSDIQPFELLVGTRNKGKVREIQKMLEGLPFKLRSLSEFPEIPEVEEVGRTYEQNSTLKALTYANLTQLPTLADDSGLEVYALGGIPGPLSARFSGPLASDAERTQKLLSALDQKNPEARTARFVCCLTLAGWDQDETGNREPLVLKVTRAELEGEITSEPRGGNGFGYDPIFVPRGFNATLGELPVEVKNRISHRANALAQMRDFLVGWIRPT